MEYGFEFDDVRSLAGFKAYKEMSRNKPKWSESLRQLRSKVRGFVVVDHPREPEPSQVRAEA